jgi:hypothetical protein
MLADGICPRRWGRDAIAHFPKDWATPAQRPGLKGRYTHSVHAADRIACADHARRESPSLEKQNQLARGTVDGAGHRSANEGLAIRGEWRCFRMRRTAARSQTRPLPTLDQGQLGRGGRREAGTTMTEGAGPRFVLGSGSIACLCRQKALRAGKRTVGGQVLSHDHIVAALGPRSRGGEICDSHERQGHSQDEPAR